MNNETKILTMLETLVEDMGGVKQDVSGLKQDVSSLKQGQERLEQRMDGLEQEFSSLKQDVSIFKLDVSSLKQGQERLEQDVKLTKEIIIKMENEDFPRFNILFDAVQVNKEANEAAVQRISVLEKKHDKLDLRMMVLETV
jgi:chromosome segregation ATPase